jgi:ParB/RepB/Spo0J family partition protein
LHITDILIKDIDTSLITNCRRDLDVEDLKLSIQKTGLQTPIGVCKQQGSSYAVIYGFRRLEAMKQLGIETIPVRVLEDNDESSLYLLNLQENVTRKNLSPIEEAEAIQRLIELGNEIAEFAPALGWTKTLITQRLSLLNMSVVVQEALHTDSVSVRQAKLIDKAEDQYQEELVSLAQEGATLKTLQDELDCMSTLGISPTIESEEEYENKLPLDEGELDSLLEKDDQQALAEANNNLIKATLLDCGAKCIKDYSVYFGFQVALSCVDFSKLPKDQLGALLSAINCLGGQHGLNVWGESSNR